MTSARRFSIFSGLTCVGLLLAPTHAAAEVTPAQRATAEALFQQATQLMDEQRFNEACDKFAASQELDAGLGTMLYLADCYEQAGKTASAWALFREAVDSAHRAQQADREHIANERASSLESRLSKLELRVPKSRQVPGLEIRINDAAVPSASWNVPLPIDPGLLRIEARAPGKKPWKAQFDLAKGPTSQVEEVPELAAAPQALNVSTPADHDAAQQSSGSIQRSVGYVVGAVGVVALAAGGFFGYRAYSLNKQSKADCRSNAPNACTQEGVSTRADAQTASTLSTVVSAGGGALVATGVALIFTAPSAPTGRASQSTPQQASAPIVGLQVGGVW